MEAESKATVAALEVADLRAQLEELRADGDSAFRASIKVAIRDHKARTADVGTFGLRRAFIPFVRARA